MFRLRVWQPKQHMSEAGCSMGHWYKPLVTNWMKTSHSLRIHGKESMEPRGIMEVREKIFQGVTPWDSAGLSVALIKILFSLRDGPWDPLSKNMLRRGPARGTVWFGAKGCVGPPPMTEAGSSPRLIHPGTELSFGKLDLNIFPSMAIKTLWASAAHVTATQRHSKQPRWEGTVNRTLLLKPSQS